MTFSAAFDEDLHANCLNSKALKGWTGALDAVALATLGAGGINMKFLICSLKPRWQLE